MTQCPLTRPYTPTYARRFRSRHVAVNVSLSKCSPTTSTSILPPSRRIPSRHFHLSILPSHRPRFLQLLPASSGYFHACALAMSSKRPHHPGRNKSSGSSLSTSHWRKYTMGTRKRTRSPSLTLPSWTLRRCLRLYRYRLRFRVVSNRELFYLRATPFLIFFSLSPPFHIHTSRSWTPFMVIFG